MNNGWIKLHRSFLDWEWYECPNTARLFIHCLLKANHKDGKYKGDDVPRGTFLTSLELLSQQTGLSVKSVRTSLKHLEKTGEVGTKRARKGTRLTVCNYATYQSLELGGGTESGTQGADEGHEEGTQGATNKNDNNYNNNKNDNNPIGVSVVGSFKKFYDLYPKPFAYQCNYTKSAFNQAVTEANGEEVILAACQLYADYIKQSGKEISMLPKSQSWLESQQWRVDWMTESKKIKGNNTPTITVQKAEGFE